MNMRDHLSQRGPAMLSGVLLVAGLSLLLSSSTPDVSPQAQRILPPSPQTPPGSPPRLDANYGKTPLLFILNKGQIDGDAAFFVQGRDKTIYFTPSGLTFVLRERTSPGAQKPPVGKEGGGLGFARRWVVKMDFVGSNIKAKPEGLEESEAVFSFFKGKAAEWKAGIPAYTKIIYRNLWPGIDLVYSGTVDRMKYEFVVRPGGDPGQIKIAYRGAQSVRMNEEGRISVETPAGGFQDDVPIAFQEIDGKRVDIPIAYDLERTPEKDIDPGPGGHAVTYGFHVTEYDRGRTLVLDPAVLVFCGFVGGSADDRAHGVAVDLAGNAYITGETSSMDLGLPIVAGPDPTYNGGESDAFVAKLNPEGTGLIFCGYIGGGGKDSAADIKVDPEGNVYIAGTTDSPETTFPVTVGPDLTYNGGESDAFVAKLNPEGTSIAWCGYVGGSGKDVAAQIAWEVSGVLDAQIPAVYITGSTSSNEVTFPVVIGPDLTYNGGESDAFVAKMKADGTGLEFCGYIGGAGNDEASALAVKSAGWMPSDVFFYVVGKTSSTETTFPVVNGPDLTYNGGESDAFVAEVVPDGTQLALCGYIGGAGLDVATDIAVYGGGSFGGEGSPLNEIITGYTSSRESTFPVAVGPDLTYNGGEYDAYVAALGFGAVYWCGYIGGAGADVGSCIVRYKGDTYVAGNTSSTESTFPVTFGSDMTYNGGASDVFLARLPYDLSGIASCGYIGGAGADRAEGMAVMPDARDVMIVGSTDSSETSFPVTGGPDLSYNGGAADVFAARISRLGPTLTSLSRTSATVGDPGFTLTVTGSDFFDGAQVRGFGRNLPTTFISDTELQAAVATEDLASPSPYGPTSISVENPDHEISTSLHFTVRPGPLILTSLSPARATAGGAGFVLTLSGSGFVPFRYAEGGGYWYGQPVLWNGVSKDSTYVSYAELQVNIAESDIANGGEVQVIVKDAGTNSGDSNALIFSICSFSLAPSPSSKTVTAGEAATYAIQLTPQFGSFDSPVSFSCGGVPARCTVSFSPAAVTPGSGTAATILTLTTSGSSGSAAAATLGSPGDFPVSSLWPLISLLALLWLSPFMPVRTRARRRWLTATAIAFTMMLIIGCNVDYPSPKPTPTPKGTYQITVQGKSGGLTVSTTVSLIVK